jgi:hypothetical protein
MLVSPLKKFDNICAYQQLQKYSLNLILWFCCLMVISCLGLSSLPWSELPHFPGHHGLTSTLLIYSKHTPFLLINKMLVGSI